MSKWMLSDSLSQDHQDLLWRHTAWHILSPTLNSPGLCPFLQRLCFLHNPGILARTFSGSLGSPLASWLLALSTLPNPSPHMAQLSLPVMLVWAFPAASGCALPWIYNKASLQPHLGAIMPSFLLATPFWGQGLVT